MGFLDRFKKEKEQQTQKRNASVDISSKKKEKQDIGQEIQEHKKEKNKKEKTQGDKQQAQILLRPYLTEKIANLSASGTYAFVVPLQANRTQVKQAVKVVYGVLPESVCIQRISGKRLRFRGIRGKRHNWKKALVTLPKGEKIEVFENT